MIERRTLLITLTIPVVLLSMMSIVIHSLSLKPISIQYEVPRTNVLKIVGMDFNETEIQPPRGPDLIADYAITGTTGTRYLRVVVGEEYSLGRWSFYGSSTSEIRQKLPTAFIEENTARGNLTITRLRDLGQYLPTVLYTVNTSLTKNVLDYNLPTTDHIIYAVVAEEVQFYDTQNVLSTSNPLPPYVQYSVSFSYREYDEKLLKKANVVKDIALLYIPSSLKEICAPIAEEATVGKTTVYEKMMALCTYLSTRYQLTLQYRHSPSYADPIAWFLIDEPKGHSLNFNSALVMLARSIGIPARLVGGYLINENEGTRIVLPSQRRAYAEVEFEGLGWVSFDATPEPPISVPIKIEPNSFVFPQIIFVILGASTIIVAFTILRSINLKAKVRPSKKTAPSNLKTVDERLLIEFPQIESNFPIVWGIGEPLHVKISLRMETPPSSRLSLRIDGSEYPLPKLVDGSAATTIKDLTKGYHEVSALLETKPQNVESRVRLKIVEYREEVVELFNEMFRKLRDANTNIEDALTVREFSTLLHNEYPHLSEADLNRVASIFEFSDYSIRKIARPDYEGFYLAKKELEMMLGNDEEHQ